MINSKCYYIVLLSILLFFSLTESMSALATENNLAFNGTLVTEPCNLDPETTDVVVDFGTVIKKGLYLNNRTNAELFSITLTDCDTTLGEKVEMTFKGAESDELPGMLAVAGEAKGVAIGMATKEGRPLPFNQPVPAMLLNDGTTNLTFQAWVEGEPEAIKDESIISGAFSAIATFEIDYP